MTELSFLLELLLEYELPKEVQKLLKERIKEIEVKPSPETKTMPVLPRIVDNRSYQPIREEVIQPDHIAQTPAASKAMADREALMFQALSGKPLPGQTGPRKLGRQ